MRHEHRAYAAGGLRRGLPSADTELSGDGAARRIGFYERHGFTVNADYAYFQPALVPGGDPLPMHLLTTGGACTACELRAMETLVHTRVYVQAPAAEQ